MTITRAFWFWQARKRERQGWTKDGGIWPVVRMVRPARLDDYFYGGLAPKKPMGLEVWLSAQDQRGNSTPPSPK